jgi:hypothetical protein
MIGAGNLETRPALADVPVDHAKQIDDRRLIRGDRVEIAHGADLSRMGRRGAHATNLHQTL